MTLFRKITYCQVHAAFGNCKILKNLKMNKSAFIGKDLHWDICLRIYLLVLQTWGSVVCVAVDVFLVQILLCYSLLQCIFCLQCPNCNYLGPLAPSLLSLNSITIKQPAGLEILISTPVFRYGFPNLPKQHDLELKFFLRNKSQKLFTIKTTSK